MNISRLRTFLTLAECLSFTEAAEQLYCSQPSVSMQIQGLEQELGFLLFDRIGKRLYLTEQGKEFRPYAEQIVNLLHSAKEHIQESANLARGTLSFGASNFVGTYLVPPILRRFHDRFPAVKIQMHITSSRTLVTMLEANKVDFLLVSDQIPFDETHYQSTTFHQDELVLIASPEHRLASRRVCELQDLLPETLILKPQHSATRSFLESKFQEHGAAFENVMEISNHEAIKQAVIHGLGVSLVSKYSVQQEAEFGLLSLIPIRDVHFNRGVKYVHYGSKHLSPAVKQFLALLCASTE
ncbi:MAG TPA: LysR family transcriptional regulator [Symbiobacteriaceae bacterium]|nr:LysR family transcriptional regulator [Symbiobacteriaceae bacterium]